MITNESVAINLIPRRILLSAQTLAPGNGGICKVARMTASALSGEHQVHALACQDPFDYRIESISVRAFNDRRAQFVVSNVLSAFWATHVVYDFAGTARAHFEVPLIPRPFAVWVHGWEAWPEAPAKYLR